MNKICLYWLITCFLSIMGFSQQQPPISPAEILDKIDQNLIFQTAAAEIDMIVTIKNRTITKSMISYARGNEKSYIEFLSPARDRGTRILKVDNIIKIYYPSAERVMRISGHMMRQSMMGSDFSYEDVTERAKKMREEYSAEINGEEELQGRPCYLLVMTSKREKQTYFSRKVWVDKERFVGLKEELYAQSGKLLKVLTVDQVKPIKDRFYPIQMTMVDRLRTDSKTQMLIKKIDFDMGLPEGTFSERRLMKK